MINVGILLECQINIANINTTEEGNPGVGGSEYLLLQLFYYLSKDNEYNCKLYGIGCTVNNENFVSIQSDIEAVKKAAEDKTDVFIFIPKNRKPDFYKELQYFKLKSVAWIHNYISYTVIKSLTDCEMVKRVIFVSRQHYDCYIDDELIKKSDYIYNMLSYKKHEYIPAENKKPIVTYIGALIPAKGFHKLAKVWKNVLKKVPDAQLHVIGDGRLYNKNAVLGKYNIAEPKYEKKIVKYVSDDNGKILESVKFFGSLGNEKEELIEKTKVGVANPTGISETFCLSAVEYKTYGIPVVTYKGYGLLDTVRNNVDGILIKSSAELQKAIISLLIDNKKNSEYGQNGLSSGFTDFIPNKIIAQWKEAISDICNSVPAQIKVPVNYFSDDLKWLKYIHYTIKRILHIKSKSVAYSVSYIKTAVKKIVNH